MLDQQRPFWDKPNPILLSFAEASEVRHTQAFGWGKFVQSV